MIKYSISFTAKKGGEASINGSDEAIAAIERTFRKAGIKFNRNVETWDEGFYDSTPKSTKRAVTLSGSVQCPHCKWGFAPSVIDQHIREKH